MGLYDYLLFFSVGLVTQLVLCFINNDWGFFRRQILRSPIGRMISQEKFDVPYYSNEQVDFFYSFTLPILIFLAVVFSILVSLPSNLWLYADALFFIFSSRITWCIFEIIGVVYYYFYID